MVYSGTFLLTASLIQFSPSAGRTRWLSTSTSTDDLLFLDDGTYAPDAFTMETTGDPNLSFSDRISMDKRSLQEEFKRLTESKARRQRDARQN